MDAASPFLSLDGPCDHALPWLNARLSAAGLRVLQTFDLHDARVAVSDCACPHHGTDECDCQMIVLLVYGEAPWPATLILHSNDGRTWLSLINTPAQRADASIQTSIQRALLANPYEEGL